MQWKRIDIVLRIIDWAIRKEQGEGKIKQFFKKTGNNLENEPLELYFYLDRGYLMHLQLTTVTRNFVQQDNKK